MYVYVCECAFASYLTNVGQTEKDKIKKDDAFYQALKYLELVSLVLMGFVACFVIYTPARRRFCCIQISGIRPYVFLVHV